MSSGGERCPPVYESEAAANLKWVVEPESKARLNTGFRKDFTREVRFAEAGIYELHDVSAVYGPEPAVSETIMIEVVKYSGNGK
jgi:hypothetical protein